MISIPIVLANISVLRKLSFSTFLSVVDKNIFCWHSNFFQTDIFTHGIGYFLYSSGHQDQQFAVERS